MSDRVLSTVTAKETITRMQQIISGPLMDQIQQLANLGQTLSDPNVWDGTLAIKFRGDWPQTHQTLKQAQEALEQLRANSQQINQNIMTAGGN
ncbi:MAG: hypothetical protein M9936_02500 [Caldilinea sp.]|nr:pyrophosphorylase [Caldilineaceae bacterium]MCO5208537.1 hypothetical protein [Caldilinea sp.]